MPFVEVKWYAGRTQEQKQQVAAAIAKAMEDVGVPAGVTHVVFDDVERDDWKVPGEG
jgi:4-oxalocrotonate tautomerase family enzyme